jgi:hypothetical protein
MLGNELVESLEQKYLESGKCPCCDNRIVQDGPVRYDYPDVWMEVKCSDDECDFEATEFYKFDNVCVNSWTE